MSKKPTHQDPLRTAAEAKLAREHAPTLKPPTAEKLLHELQVHQIELEMQNEQLRQSQIELEESSYRYVDLYESAPVGYLTLNHLGLIDEINLAGAALLGVERTNLPYHRFASYIAMEDRSRWDRHFLSVLKDDKSLVCELALQHDSKPPFYAHLTCLRLKKDGKEPVVRVVLTDITKRKQSEIALLNSEARYASLLQSIDAAVVVHDKHTKIIKVNQSALTLLGITEDQAMGRTAFDPGWEFLNADETPMPPSLFPVNQVVSSRKSIKGFLVGARRPHNGDIVWVVTSATPVFTGEEIEEIIVSFMDVTQRKHFEDALLKSENIFRNYFELGQVGMCITSLDQKWLNVNRRLCEMLGYSKEELTQLTWVELTHPDDLEADIGQFRRLLAGEIERYSMDKRFINKDGNVIYTHLTVACQRRPDKSVEYTIASVVDITERKQIENLLKKNQKLTQDIIDGTSSLIYALDKEGKFLFANKKFTSLFDVDHNYLIGKGRECLGMPEHIAREHRANDLIIMNSHDAVLFEESNDEADGTHVYASQKFPLLDTQGQIDGVCGISTDITDHKKYEEKILSSNAELEQFSYAVSHDMRQPLRMISSYLQLLEIKLADQLDGEKREYFDYAIEGAKRIDQMLMALLEYSRVGRQGEPPTLIDSRAVLDEALLFLQPAIKEAQANLNISGDWVQIFASHDEMVRLFQNLIGNATKYRIAGRTPEITITGEVINNQWHLCVADNGVGIIPNQINRLFKVFQRLHSHAAYEGTGIGLALCRKIVEHHKGRIWAESEGEGHGSKFCIALPVLRGED